MSQSKYDVIIFGGGPAGLTAGLYTARHGLSTLLIEGKQLGGRAWEAHWVDNFPGFPEGISGPELMERFISQARRFGVEIKEETVVDMNDMGPSKMVLTRGGFYEAKAVVIATGIQKKQLSVPGEMEFKGRGVSYCAICDGPFFAGKRVAVVGPGREAVEDIVRLADIAEKIYAIPGSEGYKVEELEGLLENEKVELIEGVDLESIGGDQVVGRIRLKGDSPGELDVDGVFIILESVGTGDILKGAGIKTDEGGCIKVDKAQMTNVSGVFAAGDCVCGGMQIVTAAGEGGRAGLSVLRHVRSLKR
jgi:thioredoxin reductase (NADPH)